MYWIANQSRTRLQRSMLIWTNQYHNLNQLPDHEVSPILISDCKKKSHHKSPWIRNFCKIFHNNKIHGRHPCKKKRNQITKSGKKIARSSSQKKSRRPNRTQTKNRRRQATIGDRIRLKLHDVDNHRPRRPAQISSCSWRWRRTQMTTSPLSGKKHITETNYRQIAKTPSPQISSLR